MVLRSQSPLNKKDAVRKRAAISITSTKLFPDSQKPQLNASIKMKSQTSIVKWE